MVCLVQAANQTLSLSPFFNSNNYSPFLFEGINSYPMFRKALERVQGIEDFIQYHATNYYSGFYDGQWALGSKGNEQAELASLGEDFLSRGNLGGGVRVAMVFDPVIHSA